MSINELLVDINGDESWQNNAINHPWLGMVYIIYKNGDLGDGLLFWRETPKLNMIWDSISKTDTFGWEFWKEIPPPNMALACFSNQSYGIM